jgi:hypothetical protein
MVFFKKERKSKPFLNKQKLPAKKTVNKPQTCLSVRRLAVILLVKSEQAGKL